MKKTLLIITAILILTGCVSTPHKDDTTISDMEVTGQTNSVTKGEIIEIKTLSPEKYEYKIKLRLYEKIVTVTQKIDPTLTIGDKVLLLHNNNKTRLILDAAQNK